MKHTEFVHLHVHSEYSILDSTCRIEDLPGKAAEYKMPAVAMTDTSVLFGLIPFFKACKSSGVKPIVGVEIYLEPENPEKKPSRPGSGIGGQSLVLLVRDKEGYRNLCKLLTFAMFKAENGAKPVVSRPDLIAHAGGLICLSGNIDGEISSLLLKDKENEAGRAVHFFQNLFGHENFYLELQDHGLRNERMVIPKLIELSKKTGAPLVATNDCHYTKRDDSFAQDIARCISLGVSLNEEHPSYETSEYYIKSYEEMKSLFDFCPEALSNTIKIAERCNFEPSHDFMMPQYDPPDGKSREDYLIELCREGMKGKVDPDSKEVQDRFDFELKTIKDMKFVSYFLIVWDFINYAKKNGVPVGPGRGSAAGSLIAYLLGITNIDPIKFDLLFERFLNPARVSMPDIDIDFCYYRRGEVIDYVSRRYGKQAVAQIITFGTLAARAVIRDVGRVMGIPFPKVDQIAKMIPGEPKMTLQKAIEIEAQIKNLIEEDKEVAALFDNAMKLEGLPRNTSTHAAGIIISKGDLTDHLPLYKGQEGEIITQYDGPGCENIGLLKMDFLGLKTLTVLDNTVRMINSGKKGVLIEDINKIPGDDPKTYELLSKGNTLGVFQLESTGMRDLMKRLGVQNIADIVALVALYRPGPMQMADDFIQRKHGRVKVEYYHPSLENVLKETYGVMLYQEQVMKVAQVMGGFSLGEADNLRRIMGKKKKEEMEKQKGKFIDGCIKNKIDKACADKTFEAMEYFAGYGFNKSHSVAYSWVAYQTAWFKANHPREFMAALLTSEKNDIEKVGFYIEECRSMGIEMRPPSILHSEENFSVEDEAIRFGLSAVKNVGGHAAKMIVEKRKTKGIYKDLEDFAKKSESSVLNKKVLENLIKSGAFDELEKNRRYLFEIVDDIIRFGSGSQRDQAAGQESFLGFLDSSSRQSVSPKKKEDYPNWPEHELLKSEKELLGFYISGHPLGRYSKILKRFSTTNTLELQTLGEGKPIKIGGIISYRKNTKTKDEKPMAIIQIEDLVGTVEAVLFPRTYASYEKLLGPEAAVFIQGTLQNKNETRNIIVDEVYDIEVVQETLTSAVYIRLDEAEQNKIFQSMKAILEKYKGNARVFLDIHLATGKTVLLKLPGQYSMTPSEKAIQEIEALTGEDTVWLHIKDKPRQTFDSKKWAKKE